ncbi:MAG: hypothetical protein K6E19_11130 [Lachnospiraceae bacterium]|nr:hypothetical protein [Lachnospiraceae bacterium]
MNDFDTFFEDCCRRNKTVDRFGHSDKTLADHLSYLSSIAERNRSFGSNKSADDVYAFAHEHVERLFDKETADSVTEALKHNIITTADHHGGIFSAQAFQGDLLYGELLKRMGYKGRYTPVFSFSIVELENSTYARGLCAYTNPCKRVQLPIQPKKDLNRMVAVTKGFNPEMVERAKLLLKDPAMGFKEEASELADILDKFYSDTEIVGLERYSDQISLIAKRMSEYYFADDDSRRLVYIEAEEITRKLLIKDLKDETSIARHIFFDPKLRKAINEVRTEEGLPLSALLLRGVDEKGRRVHTELQPDGKLLGAGLNGFKRDYPTDIDSLIGLIEARELLPNGFLDAVLLFFERGITWLGGYFQAIYLGTWRDLLIKALEKAGLSHLADKFKSYDCTGYISGPVYMLTEALDGLCNAGPVELMKCKMTSDSFSERMNIKMCDAHKMGLFEIYLDLIPADLKIEGWYRTIADYVKENYGAYMI